MECVANHLLLVPKIKHFEITNHNIQTPHSTYEQTIENFPPSTLCSNTDLEEAKVTLSDLTELLSDDELRVAITEISYLCKTWADEFERKIFKGKTLLQLINDGGI